MITKARSLAAKNEGKISHPTIETSLHAKESANPASGEDEEEGDGNLTHRHSRRDAGRKHGRRDEGRKHETRRDETRVPCASFYFSDREGGGEEKTRMGGGGT